MVLFFAAYQLADSRADIFLLKLSGIHDTLQRPPVHRLPYGIHDHMVGAQKKLVLAFGERTHREDDLAFFKPFVLNKFISAVRHRYDDIRIVHYIFWIFFDDEFCVDGFRHLFHERLRSLRIYVIEMNLFDLEDLVEGHQLRTALYAGSEEAKLDFFLILDVFSGDGGLRSRSVIRYLSAVHHTAKYSRCGIEK